MPVHDDVKKLVGMILPAVFDRSLYYRPDHLTNAYFHPAFMGYDFMALGVEQD